MKLRIGSIAGLVIAILGLASTASACEKCVSAGSNNWVKCESGHTSGYQSCWGGFGDPCTLVDACGTSGGGGPLPILEPASRPAIPCLTCVEDKPTQGFELRAELTAAERSDRD